MKVILLGHHIGVDRLVSIYGRDQYSVIKLLMEWNSKNNKVLEASGRPPFDKGELTQNTDHFPSHGCRLVQVLPAFSLCTNILYVKGINKVTLQFWQFHWMEQKSTWRASIFKKWGIWSLWGWDKELVPVSIQRHSLAGGRFSMPNGHFPTVYSRNSRYYNKVLLDWLFCSVLTCSFS